MSYLTPAPITPVVFTFSSLEFRQNNTNEMLSQLKQYTQMLVKPAYWHLILHGNTTLHLKLCDYNANILLYVLFSQASRMARPQPSGSRPLADWNRWSTKWKQGPPTLTVSFSTLMILYFPPFFVSWKRKRAHKLFYSHLNQTPTHTHTLILHCYYCLSSLTQPCLDPIPVALSQALTRFPKPVALKLWVLDLLCTPGLAHPQLPRTTTPGHWLIRRYVVVKPKKTLLYLEILLVCQGPNAAPGLLSGLELRI